MIFVNRDPRTGSIADRQARGFHTTGVPIRPRTVKEHKINMIADATGSQEKTIRAFLRDGVLSALDVGCGTGERTARIARQTGETVGIDPEAGHVRRAQARHGGRHLCFLTARAEALCFTAASFDAVFFNESLHHVPAAHPQAALSASHRVLKPRGRMLVIEPIHGSGSLGWTLRLYLEEKEPEQSAIAAIEAVAKPSNRLHFIYTTGGSESLIFSFFQIDEK